MAQPFARDSGGDPQTVERHITSARPIERPLPDRPNSARCARSPVARVPAAALAWRVARPWKVSCARVFEFGRLETHRLEADLSEFDLMQLALSESEKLESAPSRQHPSLPELPSQAAPVENSAGVHAVAALERGHAPARSIRGTASEKQGHPGRSGRSACTRRRAHCPAWKPLLVRCAIPFRWSAC